MKSILFCLFVAFASPTLQTSVEKKLSNILHRLEVLEKENVEKDEVIARLVEKTKYCPTAYPNTGYENRTMQRTGRASSNPLTVGLPAAFHARLSHDLHNVGVSQPIVFDLEVVDTTNSYEPRDGIFTAPVTGIYVFYWNLLTNQASGMDTTLDSSKGALGFGFVSHAENWENGGNLIIAKLTAGTHVWIKKADKYGDFLHERFSTFSGYLLSESD